MEMKLWTWLKREEKAGPTSDRVDPSYLSGKVEWLLILTKWVNMKIISAVAADCRKIFIQSKNKPLTGHNKKITHDN